MIERLEHLDDPRLGVYRNLKDRELALSGERFIAEGQLCTVRLLASDYPVESVLAAERKADDIIPLVAKRPGVPLYVVPDPLIHRIVGYSFHTGVIACGRRKKLWTVEQLLEESERATFVVLPEIASAANLGSIIRIAAAFGSGGVILGERSCDPFYRQSIRISMGNIFRLPLVRSEDLAADLAKLSAAGTEIVAAVCDESAEPLSGVARAKRSALLFGNEAQGLGKEWESRCARRVTIPMGHGTDSLNVHVAAAVFLYEYGRGR